VIDIPTKEELYKVKPPKDVVNELKKLVTITGFTNEQVKKAFYKALTLPMMDQFDDIDERCRQAMYLMIAQLKSNLEDAS
jgi:hypothetical protein